MSGFDKSQKMVELIDKGWIEVPNRDGYLVQISKKRFKELIDILDRREFHVYDAEAIEDLLDPGE